MNQGVEADGPHTTLSWVDRLREKERRVERGEREKGVLNDGQSGEERGPVFHLLKREREREREDSHVIILWNGQKEPTAFALSFADKRMQINERSH